MKKTQKISENAVKFNVCYTELEAGAKLVRQELLKNLSYVRTLAKEARRLYKFGDGKCYVAKGNCIVEPIGGIKNLCRKMEMLDWLAAAHVELRDLADCFDIRA